MLAMMPSSVAMPSSADGARQEVRVADERGDEARGRPVIELRRRRELLDAPGVEHADAVGERERLVLVVGDEDRRRARRPEDALHLVAHLGAEIGVEVRERLVEQEERGRRSQRAGEGDALLLTSGELVGIATPEAREPDHLESGRHALAPGAAAQLGETEGHVVGHGQVGKERVVLEHDAHAALLGRNGAARPGHDAAAEMHRPRVGRLQPGDDPERGGLSAPRRSRAAR